jgi:hypothetical protein
VQVNHQAEQTMASAVKMPPQFVQKAEEGSDRVSPGPEQERRVQYKFNSPGVESCGFQYLGQ